MHDIIGLVLAYMEGFPSQSPPFNSCKSVLAYQDRRLSRTYNNGHLILFHIIGVQDDWSNVDLTDTVYINIIIMCLHARTHTHTHTHTLTHTHTSKMKHILERCTFKQYSQKLS